MLDLARQLDEVLGTLEAVEAPAALIGGLALAAHGVVRATLDVDFLIDAEAAARLHERLLQQGHECLYRSEDAGNYVRGPERLDFLYAHRPIARKLLAGSEVRKLLGREVRVIGVEGLIAFKLQALCNDPRRTQDLEDIRALLRTHHASVDRVALKGYFELFSRMDLHDELLPD
ncbi:MAG: hypothetical protein IT479_02945 [Xanthomonadales bacterium]|nr:hypothetical protein [Xanthomonadales bacterium]MCC6592208.1 hypothetical protein [Xanthomonadales bacterium]MCE7931612.1 hypothetical protein [Xanthomonadales bacterium PRO6]